jgi:hypothetical protein
MPSLSASFNAALGPIVTLFLTPPAILHSHLTQAARARSQQTPINVHAANALIDSGATITCVTAQVAQTAGLPLIGKRNMGTAGGVVPANAYLEQIPVDFTRSLRA